MKILVTTPTGTLGSRVLRRLLQQSTSDSSLRVRVIARDPRKLPESIRAAFSFEVIKGSHDDPEVLLNALDGIDAVFWCQPDSIITEDVHEFYREFAAVGRDGFLLHKTPRVVAISAAGAEFARHAGPISAMREMEKVLVSSGAAIRFLRCGTFFENLLWQMNSLRAEGSFFYSISGRVKHPMVACDDIVTEALHWLTNKNWSSVEMINLLGPANLSYDDVAETLSHALCSAVQYMRVSHHEYLEMLLSLGYHESAADSLQDMFDAIEVSDWQSLQRNPPSSGNTTLHDWARKYLRPHFCPSLAGAALHR